MTREEKKEQCRNCTSICPMEEMACVIAEGRMHATNALIECNNKIERIKSLLSTHEDFSKETVQLNYELVVAIRKILEM